jgi:NAD(P)H-hydrate repair Nnr-like enzyme with NAD(P)H-hydrate dehydratase domain
LCRYSKGAADVIAGGGKGGAVTRRCDVGGSYRRCGGQGDVLAGAVATFLAWGSSSAEVTAAVLTQVAKEEEAAVAGAGAVTAAAAEAVRNGASLATLSPRDAASVASAAALGGCTVTRRGCTS